MTERKSLESERAELVALADRFMSQDIAWIEYGDAGPWLTDKESDLVSTALRLAAQDQKPFGWLGKDGKFSVPHETTRDQFLSHFHENDPPIGTPVIPLYLSPPPAAGWDEAIEAAVAACKEVQEGMSDECDFGAGIAAKKIEALRHNAPPDSGAGEPAPKFDSAWDAIKNAPKRMPDHGGADTGVREALERELSGNSGQLRDVVAAAIRGDGSDLCDGAWDSLSDDRKEGWRGDADRALAAIKKYLTALSKPAPVAANASAEARLREALEKARTILKGPHHIGGASLMAMSEAYSVVDEALSTHPHASDCDKQGEPTNSEASSHEKRRLDASGEQTSTGPETSISPVRIIAQRHVSAPSANHDVTAGRDRQPSDRTADVTVEDLTNFIMDNAGGQIWKYEAKRIARALLDAFKVSRP